MKRITILSVLLFMLLNSVNAQISKQQKYRFDSQINIIMDAFKTKKVAKLNTILTTGYTIKGLPKGIEPLALPQIVQQLPSFTKYEIKNVTAEKENYRVFLVFILKEEKLSSNLLIDKHGKIKELNLLEDSKIDVN